MIFNRIACRTPAIITVRIFSRIETLSISIISQWIKLTRQRRVTLSCSVYYHKQFTIINHADCMWLEAMNETIVQFVTIHLIFGAQIPTQVHVVSKKVRRWNEIGCRNASTNLKNGKNIHGIWQIAPYIKRKSSRMWNLSMDWLCVKQWLRNCVPTSHAPPLIAARYWERQVDHIINLHLWRICGSKGAKTIDSAASCIIHKSFAKIIIGNCLLWKRWTMLFVVICWVIQSKWFSV